MPHLNAVPYNPSRPPVRGEAIQALNRDVLIQRSLEVSPSGFITIISIIQGVALALLAQNTFPHPNLLQALQSITMMLVFVTVFYFYLTQSVLIRWAPSIVDCSTPFLVAGLEIPPAYFLGDPVAWNAWQALFWSLTTCGVWITAKWTPRTHFGRVPIAHKTFQQLLTEIRLACLAGSFGAALCALIAYQGSRLLGGVGGVVVILGTIATVVARTELRASQIHARYGVNRPPFN